MCSLQLKRYTFCITSTAYATIGTTRIHHVYKPDFNGQLSFLPRPEVETRLKLLRNLFEDINEKLPLTRTLI